MTKYQLTETEKEYIREGYANKVGSKAIWKHLQFQNPRIKRYIVWQYAREAGLVKTKRKKNEGIVRDGYFDMKAYSRSVVTI